MVSEIIGLLGTAASGVMSYLNNKKAQSQSDAEFARQQAYAEAKASENPLSRADNRAYIGEYDRAAEKQVQTNRARNKILGATPEADIAMQGKVAEGRASLLSGLAQRSTAQRDKWDAVAEQSRQQQANYQQQLAAQRNETYAALAANAAQSLGGMWGKDGETTANTAEKTAEKTAANTATTTPDTSAGKSATGMAAKEAEYASLTGKTGYDLNALTNPKPTNPLGFDMSDFYKMYK